MENNYSLQKTIKIERIGEYNCWPLNGFKNFYICLFRGFKITVVVAGLYLKRVRKKGKKYFVKIVYLKNQRCAANQ